MESAIATAASLAHPGVSVVLSPGCASFDWYRNYEERGTVFKQLVREHLERERSLDPSGGVAPSHTTSTTEQPA